jgi:hypothetical protein
MAKFVIRRSEHGTISGILPGTPLPFGTALKYSAKNADSGENTFALADDTGFLGFMTRDSRVQIGLTLEEQTTGISTFDSPFTTSGSGTVYSEVKEVEFEGADFMVQNSGTGAITSGTTAGTRLGFVDGKFFVAQSGDRAYFEVVTAAMTPEDAGNVRVYARELEGQLLA